MPETLLSGFSRHAVEEISRQKGEPAWMLEKRLKAWEIYENTPVPLGRRGDLGTLRLFSNFRFQDLAPYVPTNGNSSLPAPISHALEQALVDQRSGLVLQRNASVVRNELTAELTQRGVILTDLETAVREHPALVQQHFMTNCVPVATDKYTALH
ncbi:MAG: Fe-S cluster assembly protein SufD, partial [Ktedonobacteraceae bacterium]